MTAPPAPAPGPAPGPAHGPGPGPGPVSRHASAGGLVQAMAKASRVDSAHIRTVLAHVEDRRGVLEVLLDDSVLKGRINVDIREARTVEAFVSHLLGTGFHALTFSLRPGPDRPFPSTAALTEVAAGELTEHPERAIPEVFTDATLAIFDTARRATSVFDGTTTEDLLVQLPDVPPPEAGDGPAARLSFRDVALQVARLAREAGLPLASVHAPVAAPASRGVPRGVTGPCLRVGVAFPQHDVCAPLRFGIRLIELCSRRGYGLWQQATSIGDDRDDFWQPVVPLPAGAGAGGEPAAPRRDLVPAAPRGLAVTCVGPARTGQTEAILQVLARAGSPLLGLAETTLDDIALVHLLTHTPLAREEVAALATDVPADVLLSRALGVTDAAPSETLRDYRAVVSSRRLRRNDGGLAALWLTWAAPARGDALRLAVRTLRTALDVTWDRWRQDATTPPRDGHLEIGYLLCREASVDWLHGTLRIAVDLDALGARHPGPTGAGGPGGPTGPGGLQGPGSGGGRAGDTAATQSTVRLGRFCSDLEWQWRAALAFALGTPHVDLEVVWRESWMGRWVSLLDAPRDDLA